jgi:carboxylesterase type B
MSDWMARSLIQFAETGSPGARDLKWPAWTPDRQRYVIFGESIQVATMRPQRMEWLARHPPGPNQAAVPGRTTRD